MTVVVVGPFPPPVHGMSKNLEIFFKDISAQCEAIRVDVSPGSLERGLAYHVKKFGKFSVAFFRCISVFWKSTSLYVPPDGGIGFFYSFLFILMALFFRVRVYLHHRSFSYIDKKNWLMWLVTNLGGGRISHIFLCKDMEMRFGLVYPIFDSIVLSNSLYIDEFCNGRKFEDFSRIRLGFLSNLSEEKGYYQVIDTFEQALASGLDVTLKIGGAVYEDAVRKSLSSMEGKYPNRFLYVGYVDSEAKKTFFSDVDVFLFPTKYRMEAQPNVVFEAAGAGVPTISVARGCIASDIDIIGGWVVKFDNFPASSVAILHELIKDFNLLKSVSCSVVENIKKSSVRAKGCYSNLLRSVATGKSVSLG